MVFQKTILPRCPACNQHGIRVKESRPIIHGTRRRKQCELCNHRFTTYEINSQYYEEYLQVLSKQNAILKLLEGSNDCPPVTTIELKCSTCSNNTNDQRCALSLPEFNTPDSFDCNHYG